eukprot:581402-Lingulodinium_polyedra.AAC.1
MRESRRKGGDASPSTGSPSSRVRLWLIDAGCGHDLVTKSEAQKMKEFVRRASVPMSFNTANGLTHADEVLPVE